jgi:hypothetical protein
MCSVVCLELLACQYVISYHTLDILY